MSVLVVSAAALLVCGWVLGRLELSKDLLWVGDDRKEIPRPDRNLRLHWVSMIVAPSEGTR